MQMAKLERLARNGSGKENFVAKCAGIEKSQEKQVLLILLDQ